MRSGFSATSAESLEGTCFLASLGAAESELNPGSMALLVRMVEEHETWKSELSNEIKTREQLAQEVKDESLKRVKLAEELSQISKDRIVAETEIANSFRKVMAQGAEFRYQVCREAAAEAAEQRTVLAKEIRSDLEATLEDRITDLRVLVERNTTILNNRCDACDDRFVATDKHIEYLLQRMNSHKETSKAEFQSIAECALKALAEELQKNSAEASCYNDDIKARFFEIEQRLASREQKLLEGADAQHSFRRCQEMTAALREDLIKEVKERKHLGNRLQTGEDHNFKQVAMVSAEVAKVQQHIVDLRESLRLDMQSRLLQQKQASEDRVSSLLASLQTWQEKSIQSFEKQTIDVSTLREHMTEHMSWVAKDHETEVSQLKTQVLNLAGQTQEVFAQVSSLKESERMARANDTTPRASHITSVSRSTTPARLRPVSPVRSMPQPPLMVPQVSCSATASTLSGDASIPINVAIGRDLPKPPDIGIPVSQGGLQRTPSIGLLSARFSGPPRITR